MLKEEVYDVPIKTQVSQIVILEEKATPDEVRAELKERYRQIAARTGFRFHNSPNSIWIHVYGSEAQAGSDLMLWVAMLAKSAVDKEFEITVNEARLLALQSNETKHGLSEETRKAIHAAWIEAERRADNEAAAKVPDSEWRKQAELSESLSNNYRSTILKQYKITKEQASSIASEGFQKGWP